MQEFLAMGGYAAFVWPAYAASALAFAGLAWAVFGRTRALKRRLAEAEKRARAEEREP